MRSTLVTCVVGSTCHRQRDRKANGVCSCCIRIGQVSARTLFSLLLFVAGLCSTQPLVRAMAAASVLISFAVHYMSMMPPLAEMQEHSEVGGKGRIANERGRHISSLHHIIVANSFIFIIPFLSIFIPSDELLKTETKKLQISGWKRRRLWYVTGFHMGLFGSHIRGRFRHGTLGMAKGYNVYNG